MSKRQVYGVHMNDAQMPTCNNAKQQIGKYYCTDHYNLNIQITDDSHDCGSDRLRQRDAAGLVTSPIKTKARAVAKRGALIPAHGLIKSSHRTTKKRKKHVDNTWKKEN